MKFLEHLRAGAFWAIDFIRGGKIRKAYKLLSDMDTYRLQESEISTYTQNRVRDLLRHCVKTVPAYSGLDNLMDTENPLLEWPVVNKSTFKNNPKDYMSSKFEQTSLIPMTTSGSTGTPFTCWQNKDKKRHVNAEVLYYNGKIGYNIGRRIIYFRSVVQEVAKSPLSQFMQNICLLDCTDLSDDSIKKKLKQIARLSKKGGAMILSYASTLDAFRRYFEKNGSDEARECNIYGIVSGSEMLQDITRHTISKTFNCPVVSRYANEENGFLGQDETLNNVFIPNRANYCIEILKFDKDTPAEIGEIGRIVVTDLYNYAMPMVRYDTGDVGAWQFIDIDGRERLAIGNFGGRKIDMIYDSSGNIISPHTITNNMWKYTDINQYQFVQLEESKYLLRINSDKPVNTNELIETYKKIVGQDAQIEIELCDEIPVLQSGKRKYIVNQMQ